MTRHRAGIVVLLMLLLAFLAFGCGEDGTSPQEPLEAQNQTDLSSSKVVSLSGASGVRLSGAIFTTTPDGSIVNENVHYEQKIEVYLDGGPPPNAPQHAAGLPDGWYVFQVTDPSGWVLLSQDPAKCRVLEIQDDIIVRLVLPSEFGLSNDYTVGNGGGTVTYPCHIQEEPDGVAGPSGRHDTNTDVDYGENGAIVVQLMPFLDTPNPGGVYKAWVTPFEDYQAMGGDLDEVPSKVVKKKGVFQGFANDPGFGPPRNRVKTDNFKVKEVPPMVHVHKFEDVNGNGVWDPGEPEIPGWKIYITETLHDGTTVTNECYTPCWRTVPFGATVTVEEELPDGWAISALIVDDSPKPPSTSVDVTFGQGPGDHTVVFGNYEIPEKSGYKRHDLNGDGNIAGDPGLPGWKIVVSGTDGKGQPVNEDLLTDAQGYYKFELPPGSYTVSEVCPGGWYQTVPTPTNGCGSGVYNITLLSGDVEENNNFGNFQPISITVRKFLDCNRNQVKDDDESFLAGFEFCLYDEAGNLVSPDDFVGTPQAACMVTPVDGVVSWVGLLPGTYKVVETTQEPSWFPSGKTDFTFTDLESGDSVTYDFGNFPPVFVTAEKYHDLNGNGVKDEGEPPVEGFTFCLKDENGNLVSGPDFIPGAPPQSACKTTGPDGLVVWSGLLPGVMYTVEEVPQDNWDPTTPDIVTVDFTKCGDPNQKVIFGNILTLCRVTGGQVDDSGLCTNCAEGTFGNNRYTCGGQAGAYTALQPQPYGEWTHTNHKGTHGRFTFHAGTASAPDDTEIDWISCMDPPNCFPARPAPAKQIDFGGVGTFKNVGPKVPFKDMVTPKVSLHYFEVNIDDLGEPGKSGFDDPNPAMCPKDGFGRHSSTPDGVCDCPDFYRITIYKGPTEASGIMYEAQGYIKGGNFQIHPLTGYDQKQQP